MFYEETVSAKWNHEQHDETMSMEGTTIKRQSESKFMICPTQKSLFSCAQPNTTKFDIGANLICRSKCKCTQH